MRYEFNFRPAPFQGYTEFDELELFNPSTGTWQGEVSRRSPEHIRWAQNALNRIMNLRLAVDGRLGAQTRSAIRSFQQRSGLSADGDVGPLTEAALIKAGASPPPGGQSAQGQSGRTPQPQAPIIPTAAPTAAGGVVSKPCPVKSPGSAKDRCTAPGTLPCPTIPDLLCVTSVGGVPFEYVFLPGAIGKDSTGLFVVKKPDPRPQRFIPAVVGALNRFITYMAGVGMPVRTIFTGGSHYCRCITGTNSLSNHSYGDAIDVAGVRWQSPIGIRQTLVHNYANPGERAILRRINACLRLSFATVIDYHRKDHRDHFHCDTNRGRGRSAKGREMVVFIKEALNIVMGLGLSETPAYDAATDKGLRDFSGRTSADLSNSVIFNKVLDDLFTRVARVRCEDMRR